MVKPPFIGREAELAALLDASHQAAARHGTMVLVEGGPGLGKSTLVEHFRTRLRDSSRTRPVTSAVGYCYEGGTDSAFYPWIEALSQLAVQGPERHVGKLTLDLIREVGPDLLRVVPVLGDAAAAGLKALSVAGDWWLAATPKDDAILSRNIPLQFTDAVVALAEVQGPMLLVIEDAHWADAASARLLLQLSRRLADLPLLVLVTYRREESATSPFAAVRHELMSSGAAAVVGLEPFTEEEISQFVRAAYGEDLAPIGRAHV